MDEIIKIAAFGIVAAVLAVAVGGFNKEIALIIGIAAGAMIFLQVVPYLRENISFFAKMAEDMGMSASRSGSNHIVTLMKIIGIAYIAQFAEMICDDAGQKAIGYKVELAGKLIILVAALPILTDLLDIIRKLVGSL